MTTDCKHAQTDEWDSIPQAFMDPYVTSRVECCDCGANLWQHVSWEGPEDQVVTFTAMTDDEDQKFEADKAAHYFDLQLEYSGDR